MVISGIHLHNFKSFKDGKIEGLSSNLTNTENVVLIGGLNGAGKTTFLESLYLCLYGKGANKMYPSRGAKHENYFSLVGSLLNNDVKQSGQNWGSMYVEVFMSEVPLTGSFLKNISLKRTWSFNLVDGVPTGEPEELFEIWEGGKLVEELDPSEYQHYIDTLLPYDVSQLFLFDGEKIQDFAGDPEAEFSVALKKVLGISLYSQLTDDLKTTRSQILTEYNKHKQTGESIEKLQVDLGEKKQKVEDNKIEITNINDELDELDIELEKIKGETSRVTRIQANDRTDFERQKVDLERERSALENNYINDATNFLPFLLASNLCDEVLQQLTKEENLLNWQAAQREIEPKINQIVDFVFEGEDIKETMFLSSLQRRFYSTRLDESIREIIFKAQGKEITRVEIIHGISLKEVDKVRSFFGRVNHRIASDLAEKSARLKNIEFALTQIRNTQTQAGDSSDGIKRLFDKISEIERKVGGFEQRREDLLFANGELNRTIEAIKSQISKAEERAQVSEEQRRQIEYCEDAQKVVVDFQKRFQAKRTKDLEIAILDMWNSLAHKDKLVNRVTVLPDNNFSIELFDSRNNKLDKTKLSAGEKEIYAISLLWALVQVSGRRMPIIVDTPFGRLDSLHRRNLVTKYFPKASHQVVLLSQDEEIVGDYYTLIKPHIAIELTIENVNGESYIKDGYPFATPVFA